MRFWTLHKAKQAALKCRIRSEFKKKYPGAVSLLTRQKPYDEVCQHMKWYGRCENV